ncbi:ACT domain-containing protein [uncultured Gimesia sp.]|uniref:ACT domain-containing protein n=1 Tax=uncultured Gimesia sp. TaxID=1678688 RepID=UPI0030D71874|tara:strand:+ start:74537 stop:74935 length:399 start_codon:yes stop_codon:yes gene_type:complete
MTGESNLEKLLTAMSPELMDGEYVYCTFPDAQYGDYSDLGPVVAISESEGLTLIISKSKADEKNISYESVFKGITLLIHSSLDAVGLTAAFSNKLTEHGISANVVAGYYHDHIFVQRELAERAIEALNELAR